jgi:hypothetical protein
VPTVLGWAQELRQIDIQRPSDFREGHEARIDGVAFDALHHSEFEIGELG